MVKSIQKVLLFLLVGVVFFCVVQSVLTPYYTDCTIRDLKSIEDVQIEVIYLGASHIHDGISPMKIYEDTTIQSYNLGSSGQRIASSYFLLKEALEVHSPSVVILDTGNLFTATDDYNYAWRYILDDLKLNMNKLEMAAVYDTLDYSDGKWSAIFPIIKYHNRWNNLTVSDFRSVHPHFHFTGGQVIGAAIRDAGQNIKDMDEVTAFFSDETIGKLKTRERNKINMEVNEDPLYAPKICDEELAWLLKIKDYCDSKGIELVLTKIPTSGFPQFYFGAWTRQKSEAVQALADGYGLRFFDLQYHISNGLDFTIDTSDGGCHLNFHGAEIASALISQYLLENFDLQRIPSARYDYALEKYQKMRELVSMQIETDMTAYLENLIKNKDKWDVIITARDEYTSHMDETVYQQMDKLGLQLIREGTLRDAYVAVISRGEVIYEAVSTREINHDFTMDNMQIELVSSGWNTKPYCSIRVDGNEYAVDERGLNIIVIDKDTGTILDSVAFDTYFPTKTAVRKDSMILTLFEKYEEALCTKSNDR